MVKEGGGWNDGERKWRKRRKEGWRKKGGRIGGERKRRKEGW